MNAAINILDRMINDFVSVPTSKAVVGHQGVGIKSGASLDMLLYLRMQRVLFAIRNYLSAHLSAALKNAHNGCLVFTAGASDTTLLNVNVHVAGFAADEGLVGLNLAAHLFLERAGLHRKSDPMNHEPCSFLRNADAAMNLIRTNAVLAVDDHPDGNEPLIQAECGVFKDGSRLN